MSIRKLPDDVINKIAAGEILVRPVNAVKEMIENSIDARAENITIIISGGGLNSIQIIDDGRGIPTSDHGLLCERFATSKLSEFDDLRSGKVSSFGFRGEALASVSLVGHVSVYTKTCDSSESHGYESRYSGGQLLPGYPTPVPFNGKSGTRIIVEDLFFNNPVKKSSFKSSSNEYRLILDIVSRFAIAFPHIHFSLKKSHETSFDVQTRETTRIERIESMYGLDPKNLTCDDSSSSLEQSSPPPYPLISYEFITSKTEGSKNSSILIINDRIVENSQFIKLFESSSISSTGIVPSFLFLKLFIKSDALDVNVSPTKKSVIFLNESEVWSFIIKTICDKFSDCFKRVKLITLKPAPPGAVLQKFSSTLVKDAMISGNDVSTIAVSPNLSSGNNFKIHTCPRQNFFTLTVPEIVSTTSGVCEQPPPLSQVSLAFTQPADLVSLSPTQPDSHELLTQLRQKYMEDFSRLSWCSKTPRESLSLVGSIDNQFVICQYYSRLCICNLEFFGLFLVKWLLLSSKWLTENTDDWISTPGLSSLLMITDNGIERMPTLTDTCRKLSPEETEKFMRDDLQIFLNENKFSNFTINALDEFLTIIANYLIKNDLENVPERIWNTIVKNSRCYPPPTSGGEKLSTSFALFDTASSTEKNFFFRELISLKELYREFERC